MNLVASPPAGAALRAGVLLLACLAPLPSHAEDKAKTKADGTARRPSPGQTGKASDDDEVGPSVDEDEPETPPSRCAIQVELVAVVLDDKQGERSFAMVAQKGQKPFMVGVGSWIGGRSVKAIEPRAIWLSDPAGLCWLPLERGSRPSAPARPRATNRNKRSKPRAKEH